MNVALLRELILTHTLGQSCRRAGEVVGVYVDRRRVYALWIDTSVFCHPTMSQNGGSVCISFAGRWVIYGGRVVMSNAMRAIIAREDGHTAWISITPNPPFSTGRERSLIARPIYLLFSSGPLTLPNRERNPHSIFWINRGRGLRYGRRKRNRDRI